MDEPIAWRVELAVKPGQLESFEHLTGEMVAATRREPGVVTYERFVTEDGKIVHLHERYASAAAALAHLRAFEARFAARFSTMVERRQFVVFGPAPAPLKQMLDGFGAIYLRPLGPFDYWAWNSAVPPLRRPISPT